MKDIAPLVLLDKTHDDIIDALTMQGWEAGIQMAEFFNRNLIIEFLFDDECKKVLFGK